jgi:hypothetical protein
MSNLCQRASVLVAIWRNSLQIMELRMPQR